MVSNPPSFEKATGSDERIDGFVFKRKRNKICKHFQFLDFLQRNFPNEHECEVASAFFTFDTQIIFGDYSAVCKERERQQIELAVVIEKIMHCLFNAWFPGTLKPILYI